MEPIGKRAVAAGEGRRWAHRGLTGRAPALATEPQPVLLALPGLQSSVQATQYWKTVTVDDANLLDSFVSLLEEKTIAYCIVGGQAVNAYVEPLVSLDLDLVVSVEQLPELEKALAERYSVERFPHSVNISVSGSDLRIQIQTDPRYFDFVDRATPRSVLGRTLQVARLPDVLQGKIWAASDPTRRASKRQKDLADIARIVEAHPELRESVPRELLDRLL